MGCLNSCCHQANMGLWEEIDELAKIKKLFIRVNKQSFCNWKGVVSYVILRPGFSSYFRTSKSCLYHISIPYSKYYKPSIKGEKEALEMVKEELLTQL
jgi:hypothetical protein